MIWLPSPSSLFRQPATHRKTETNHTKKAWFSIIHLILSETQHPLRQWNLMGGRGCSIEWCTLKSIGRNCWKEMIAIGTRLPPSLIPFPIVLFQQPPPPPRASPLPLPHPPPYIIQYLQYIPGGTSRCWTCWRWWGGRGQRGRWGRSPGLCCPRCSAGLPVPGTQKFRS